MQRRVVVFALLAAVWSCEDDDDALPREDPNECVLGTDSCDPRVACIDTPTGFDCGPCPSGFVGDGRTCSLPAGATSESIGPAGGSLTTPGGAILTVPAGAVSRATDIVIREGVQSPAEFPDYLDASDGAIELNPDGATFSPPLELTLHYEQGSFVEGSVEERMIGAHYIDAAGVVEEATTLAQDLAANTITVAIPHFSFVALTRFQIRAVAAGTITNPASVARVNAKVVQVLQSLPNADARRNFLEANAALLDPYLAAAATILGTDPLAGVSITPVYTVSVTVSGLAGSGLVLQNNGGDNLPVNANGTFTFAGSLRAGDAFAVTVSAQPSNLSQTCEVAGGIGVIAAANITGVAVTCTTTLFTVGGSVTGLQGSGLELQINDGETVTVSSSEFVFATPLPDGTSYEVTILNQPTAPPQTCTLTGESGNLAGGNVTSVVVDCVTDTFSIGGTVTNLAGGSVLVLQNNGADDLSVSADGNFTFGTELSAGVGYSVSVLTQPVGQSCSVTNGEGTVGAADVVNVAVLCINLVAPVFTSAPPLQVDAGETYTYTVVATGTPAPVVSATVLPAWLSFDGTTLTGTPSAANAGDHDVTLTATNGFAPDATQSFTVTVLVDNDGDGATADVDCDDTDATIFDGAPEIADDGIDQDCSTSDLSALTASGAAYVDGADPGCSDVAPNGTTVPYCTIGAAVGGAGGTVFVAAGTYSGALTVSGDYKLYGGYQTPGWTRSAGYRDLTIVDAPSGNTITANGGFVMEGMTVVGAGAGVAFGTTGAKALINNVVRSANVGGTFYYGILFNGGTSLYLKNNVIDSQGANPLLSYGLYTQQGATVPMTIIGNTFTGDPIRTVYVMRLTAASGHVASNVFYNLKGTTPCMGFQGGSITVLGNTVVSGRSGLASAGSYIFEMQGGSRVTAINNAIAAPYASSNFSAFAYLDSSFLTAYNTVGERLSNSAIGPGAANYQDFDTVIGSPGLQAPEYVQPTTASAVYEAGIDPTTLDFDALATPVPTQEAFVDFQGNVRPLETAWEVGAVEVN